jgi:hypothetical protein
MQRQDRCQILNFVETSWRFYPTSLMTFVDIGKDVSDQFSHVRGSHNFRAGMTQYLPVCFSMLGNSASLSSFSDPILRVFV